MKFPPRISWAFVLMPSLLYSQSYVPPSGQFQNNQTWFEIKSPVPAAPVINLLFSDISSSKIEIIINGFWQESIRTSVGNPEIKAYTDNSSPLLIKGAPDLAKLTVSLAIPDRARMKVSIIEEEFTDFRGICIIPSKGNLSRDIDPDSVNYEYGREYATDALFPGVTAELRTPHIIRDVRGQTVVIYPFRYNPVQKTLRVYTRLVIEVNSADETDGENAINFIREDSRTDRAFEGIYNRTFLNYHQYQNASRYTPLQDDGKMLIISYGPFMAGMQDFVNWKNMSGIPTEMVDVSTIGSTSASIKSFVANYYNTNGLTFLLLAGDAAQVPASSTSAGYSDNDYGYIVGNDHYPDIFVGRFSAQTIAQVNTQVERTVEYEKEPSSESDYFGRAMCIASSLGPGDNGESDWAHQRNLRTDYMGFTYTYGAELYDGSQGGADAAGNPTATMVAGEINNGTGIISYTGHGSVNAWVTSGFSNTSVNNLTNSNKLPFIFSVACANGNFVSTTCFAENWMRATHNGEPTGAIATIMSTINQTWNPPMCGQDEMVDILTESYPENIRRTFGGICMNGCMKMNDVYGTAGNDMTDTWTVFGDPSLMVRTAEPEELDVTHPEEIPVGSGQLTVDCDHEGARVAISNDYELLSKGIISDGSVVLYFSPVYMADTLTVTVTAFNCLPSIDEVVITDDDMVYISSDAFHSNLGQVGPGEQNAEVLGLKIIMSGSLDPIDVESITINMDGTTNLSDVESLSVYFTGNSPTFDTATFFDLAMASPGSITFTGNQTLNAGENYFWLAYDLNASAMLGNFIDADCPGFIIAGTYISIEVPIPTNPVGARQINIMELAGINTGQPDIQPVSPGDQAVDIICVEITTIGVPIPLEVNSLKISTRGTSNLGDVSHIEAYYTSDTIFTTDELFGSSSPDDTVNINGTMVLAEGANYIWIVYDLTSQAEPGNELDAQCLEVGFAVDQGNQVPATTDPAGYRIIELEYCAPAYTYGTSYGDFISLVQLTSLNKSSSASPSPYYTFYQDVSAPLATGKSYDLTVSAGTYGTGNNIAAWIDFNHNGVFETGEKLGEVTLPAQPNTGTISFTVPTTSFIGPVRMRVREVWNITGLDPCSNYVYGETEDYQVRIMPPGCWLGITNDWNNPSNWSDGVVPGSGSYVTIPQILFGNYYPSDFTGANAVMYRLDMERGSSLNIPAGVTVRVGVAR